MKMDEIERMEEAARKYSGVDKIRLAFWNGWKASKAESKPVKITDEQIRAEAESRWLWRDELSVKIFESAAKWALSQDSTKWALSQDSTIEKVKELIEHYEKVTLDWVPRENFIAHLNAIITKNE